ILTRPVPLGPCFLIYLFLRLWGGRGGHKGQIRVWRNGIGRGSTECEAYQSSDNREGETDGAPRGTQRKECPAIQAMCSNTIFQSSLHSQRPTFFHYHIYSTAF
ncbi:unnamed protein product, partial [Tuber aestivum]